MNSVVFDDLAKTLSELETIVRSGKLDTQRIVVLARTAREQAERASVGSPRERLKPLAQRAASKN